MRYKWVLLVIEHLLLHVCVCSHSGPRPNLVSSSSEDEQLVAGNILREKYTTYPQPFILRLNHPLDDDDGPPDCGEQ